MNTATAPRLFALVLSVTMTLAIFQGVSTLAEPAHGHQLLVQAPVVAAAHG